MCGGNHNFEHLKPFTRYTSPLTDGFLSYNCKPDGITNKPMNIRSLRSFIPALLIIVGSGCKSEPYPQGKILYENFCVNCHMDNGSGLEGLIPPVVGSDVVRDQVALTACIIRNGRTEPMLVNGQRFLQPMPASPELSDFEITNIINYMRHAWSNNYGYVTLEEVRSALEECK